MVDHHRLRSAIYEADRSIPWQNHPVKSALDTLSRLVGRYRFESYEAENFSSSLRRLEGSKDPSIIQLLEQHGEELRRIQRKVQKELGEEERSRQRRPRDGEKDDGSNRFPDRGDGFPRGNTTWDGRRI